VTPDGPIVAFLAGAVSLGFLVAALFFLKFWRRTGESLFAAFAAAFVLIAANQAAPVLFGIPDEALGGVYLLRLAAFVLIMLAVLRKNMAKP
jgi:hypothetical protein